MSARLTTAVLASAIFPAVVVENNPVGISVICPPPADIGEGGVMVLIATTPETKAMRVTGAMIAALASVGAAAAVATTPADTIRLRNLRSP